MQKNFLILTCFLTSVVGLILIYVATINIQPTKIELKDINSELIGRSIVTEGTIVYKKTHTAGHLFLTISDDGNKIQIPLFSGFMGKLKERNYSEDNFEIGVKISVSGLVDEYMDQLQIIPRRVDDIKILGD